MQVVIIYIDVNIKQSLTEKKALPWTEGQDLLTYFNCLKLGFVLNKKLVLWIIQLFK